MESHRRQVSAAFAATGSMANGQHFRIICHSLVADVFEPANFVVAGFAARSPGRRVCGADLHHFS